MLVRRSTDAKRLKSDPALAELAVSVDRERLREVVRTISIPRCFFKEREANQQVAAWIAEQFQALDVDVEFQGRYANVVATTAAASEGPAILIGAHYDSVPGCPGADDNASAVAALIGAAEALTAFHADLPFCFVAFNCEEPGLLGSADFVENVIEKDGDGRLDIRAAHILEMVGFTAHQPGSQKLPPGLPIKIPEVGDFLGIVANQGSGSLAGDVLGLARTYVPELPVLSLQVLQGLEEKWPVLLRSDHAPFWTVGTPALMWTDTSEYRNPNYHEPSDLPETLDFVFLERITRLVALAGFRAAVNVPSP